MQLFKITAMILFFAMPLASAETVEEQCARIAPQQSNQVNVSIAELTVDESKSTTEDLAVMAGLYNGIDQQLGGLTSAEPLVAHEIEPNLALLPDNKGVCARPSIKLTVGYASMSVYMDREIPRNSCIYNAPFLPTKCTMSPSTKTTLPGISSRSNKMWKPNSMARFTTSHPFLLPSNTPKF
jgi:hypothetical protein